MPRFVPGAFMLVSGIVTGGIWLRPLVSAARSGEPLALLEGSTTMMTGTLDLGVIVPLTILSGAAIGASSGFTAIPRAAIGIILLL